MKNILPITEHEIQNAILELLQRQGYLAWRNNVGAQRFRNKTGADRWVRFSQPGHSDIFAVTPTGIFCAFEVKHPKKRNTATAAQREFIESVKKQGGIASVVTSTEEVATLLKLKGIF